jgi:NAD(P)-dependent dehydrogenase (short-subunit alcohol dehydrogenase family)
MTDSPDDHEMPDGLLPAALVTGGALRVGRTLVSALAELGFAVAIHCRASREKADALARALEEAGRRAVVVEGDLADPKSASGLVSRASRALGCPVGVLVNNAATFVADHLDTLVVDRLRHQLAVNLEAPLLLAQAYVAGLPPDRQGLIVNLGDQRVANPTASYLSYSVSKAGLDMAAAVLARDLAPRIRVVTLALGQSLKAPGMAESRLRALVQATPLGRPTGQDEIARALQLIVRSPSMTGTTLTLDSGMGMGWSYPGPR